MLAYYQMLTRRLLNDATFARVNDWDIRDYCNIARGQIAVGGNCLPGYGTLQVNETTQQYDFSQIVFTEPGIAGPLAIETVNYQTGNGGQQPVNAIEWARFNHYELGQPIPKPSQPRVWTQFGQGSSGTFFVNALDGSYTLIIKGKCLPVDLVDDTTPEAIPKLWTDAVPWFAAFYWLAGTGANPQLASTMLQGFQSMMQMARSGATPSTQGSVFTDAADPLMAGRLGIGGGAGGARGAQPRQQSPPTAA